MTPGPRLRRTNRRKLARSKIEPGQAATLFGRLKYAQNPLARRIELKLAPGEDLDGKRDRRAIVGSYDPQ
jgi:hypothetical protein